MRAKKNREVNIFSASVVDLFASGLGVFLIVSIIALVNQKKENEKVKSEQLEQNFSEEINAELIELKSKISKLEEENFKLRVSKLKETKEQKQSSSRKIYQLEIQLEEMKSRFKEQSAKLENQVTKLEDELISKNKTISQLEKSSQEIVQSAAKGKEGVSTNFNQYEVGSKIRLENVQFFPGTDRTIEPYASREIKEFAEYLKKNPKVMVEVSGHIFETKKAIESGKADDVYNLSGKRAKKVCLILEEFGVNPKQLSCVGYGATRYIYLTDDQYSKEAQLNRRVEIEILSK